MINYLRMLSYDATKYIYIWGTGEIAAKVQTALSVGGVIVDGLLDNAYPEGGVCPIGEVKPISILKDGNAKDTYIIIASSWVSEIKKQVLDMGEYNIVLSDELAMHYNENYNPLLFKIEDNPYVSVCITAYNNWNMTYNCLESFLENDNTCSYEIILGDNASDDETKQAEKYIKNIKVIHHKNNLQFLGNANAIVKQARGKYVFLLANDILFTKKNYLDTLLEYMEKDDSIGMITGRLWVPSQNKYDNHYIYEDFGKVKEVELNRPRNVENMWPVATLMKKTLWDNLGGLDEVYLPVYYEDVDFEMRVMEKGLDLVAVPDAEVIHYCGVTYQEGEWREEFKRNREIFRKRWEKSIKDKKKREEYRNRR